MLYKILEKTPFSIQYYPPEPYRPIANWQLQEAEYDLRLNTVHYYEWAIKMDGCFLYPLEIADCIVSYWENRWPFAEYKLVKIENTPTPDDTYTCALCGETHHKGWSDEEAKEEAKRNFGEDVFEREPVAIICDDCYEKMGLE